MGAFRAGQVPLDASGGRQLNSSVPAFEAHRIMGPCGSMSPPGDTNSVQECRSFESMGALPSSAHSAAGRASNALRAGRCIGANGVVTNEKEDFSRRAYSSTNPYGYSGTHIHEPRCVSSQEYDRQLAQARAHLDGPGVQVQACRGVPQFSSLNEPGAAKTVTNRQVGDNFVAKVVDKYGKAVVRVQIERTVTTGLDADIFSFFFGGKPAKEKKEKVRGHGSGFCAEGGIVLTNAHVVQGADTIYVIFPHGLKEEVELLGTDEVLDLAVLRLLKSTPTHSVPLGCSSGLKPGDWSIVLGHPLGLNNTVTLGIISSLERSSGETGWDWMRHALIQTDAAVNQGNSGGPLLNELGQCVGIISMRALFGEGIGFAIPIDAVKAALPLIMKRKIVPHAYLGIKMANHSDSDVDECGSDKVSSTNTTNTGGKKGSKKRDVHQHQHQHKARVELVLPGSPADKGGLKAGDIITDVDGVKASRMEDVQSKVREAAVGKKMRFKLVRKEGGKDVKVTATVTTADVSDLKKEKESNKESNSAPRLIIVQK